VGTEALVGHLDEFDRIAGEHDGNRALGTAGFDASVDYVAETLRDAGFVVDTPEFETTMFRVDGEELVVDGAPTGVNALGMSPSTGPEGLSARVVRIAPDETPGCDAADYDGLDVTGAVVVVDRGVCTFAIKEQVAADRGAAGLRSEEHTSELQSRENLVCRLLLEKKERDEHNRSGQTRPA